MHRSARFTCTDTTLVAAEPVWALPGAVRSALRAWCRTHGIDPETLVADRPVERDPAGSSVSWFADAGDGVQRRLVMAPEPAGSWPAPFPDVVRSWAGRSDEAAPVAAREAC